MTRIFKTAIVALLGGLMFLAVVPSAPATVFVLGTEDPVAGFEGPLFTFPGFEDWRVASDGEFPFDPYGFGADTSDGVQLPTVSDWAQVAGGGWTFVGDDGTRRTWVLPADLSSIGCGVENNTTCEPVGHFISPVPWSAGFSNAYILEDIDGLSDIITTFNDASGNGHLIFQSSPIPEPTSLALLGTALIGLAAMRRPRRA